MSQESTDSDATRPADRSMPKTRLLTAALGYAKLGWPVLPLHSVNAEGRCSCKKAGCTSPGKHPRTKHGVKEATTDSNLIRMWWSKHPDANVGVATGAASGLVVLDIDPRHGGDASLAALVEQHGALPNTATNRTGGGGRHLLFEHPGAGTEIRNAAGLAGHPGLDVRGDGGYIVVPPSKHASGAAYMWDPRRDPVAAMPTWLQAILVNREHVGAANPAGTAPADRVPEGQRNSYLTSVAGSMRRRNMSADAILAALTLENERKCAPPLPQAEIESITRSVARYPPAPQADDTTSPDIASWPDPPAAEAYHGLAGAIVGVIEPESESDPVALLGQFLVLLGNVIGRSAHFKAGADTHYLNLYLALVGTTSKARKGSSWSYIKLLFERVAPEWVRDHILSGLSSGEGLIYSVRDPVTKMDRNRNNTGNEAESELVVVDPGIEDKRIVFLEAELASTLRVLEREGNNLSAALRQAWETGDLRVLTKNNPTKATGAHASLIGHITNDELRRYLNRTEIANGFANRILWLGVRRSKCLPEGGRIKEADLAPQTDRLLEVIDFARSVGEMRRDDAARQLWREVYPALSEGKPGLLGAITSRAEAQVMRLACLYALLDLSDTVRCEHLQAALALWRYCDASCQFIFGDSLGDPVADDLRGALRERPAGMNRTDIRDYFQRHRSASEINRALGRLLELNLVRREITKTDGRNCEWWYPVFSATNATEATEGKL